MIDLILAVDPISLVGLALGGLAGGGAASALSSGSSSSAPTPAPAAPAAPQDTITPVQQPVGSKATGAKPQTFLGAAAAAPPTQSGSKTLLGQ